MIAPDGSTKGIPWQMLIRADLIAQLDAIVGSLVIDVVSGVGSDAQLRAVAASVNNGLRHSPDGELSAEVKLARLRPWAGLGPDPEGGGPFGIPPFPWPPKKFGDFSDVSSPLLRWAVDELTRFLATAASPEFARGVVAELESIAGDAAPSRGRG